MNVARVTSLAPTSRQILFTNTSRSVAAVKTLAGNRNEASIAVLAGYRKNRTMVRNLVNSTSG